MSLESQLELLRTDVTFPNPPDIAASIGPMLPPRSNHRFMHLRRYVLAAAVLVLLITAVLAVPDTRHALANWFGLGGIRIEFVDRLVGGDDDAPIDSTFIVGEQIDVSDASFAGLPKEEADRAYRRIDGESVTTSLVYLPGEDLPEIAETGIGALLMRIETPGEFVFLVKRSVIDGEGRFVSIGSTEGYWVQSGSLSAIPYDPQGAFGLDQVSRTTGNVLLWEVNGVTYRLETGLNRWEAVALAESMMTNAEEP